MYSTIAVRDLRGDHTYVTNKLVELKYLAYISRLKYNNDYIQLITKRSLWSKAANQLTGLITWCNTNTTTS